MRLAIDIEAHTRCKNKAAARPSSRLCANDRRSVSPRVEICCPTNSLEHRMRVELT